LGKAQQQREEGRKYFGPLSNKGPNKYCFLFPNIQLTFILEMETEESFSINQCISWTLLKLNYFCFCFPGQILIGKSSSNGIIKKAECIFLYSNTLVKCSNALEGSFFCLSTNYKKEKSWTLMNVGGITIKIQFRPEKPEIIIQKISEQDIW